MHDENMQGCTLKDENLEEKSPEQFSPETFTQMKKLPTWFLPFNFELMSHGGSEARPLARRVFNFDKNDLAQAREEILEF